MKTYYIRDNIGRAKYTVNYHDGITTHNDGSCFYGIKIFKNKIKLGLFIKQLENEGYTKE